MYIYIYREREIEGLNGGGGSLVQETSSARYVFNPRRSTAVC